MNATPASLELAVAGPKLERPALERVPTAALLAVGALLTVLIGPRWNVAALAWVSGAPFLLVARRARSAKAWAQLGAVLVGALSLQVLKIITPPIPWPMAFMFSVPAALGLMVVLGATEALRRRLGEHHGVLAFAALTALLDLGGAAFTEMGAWTATANTQNDALVLLQAASVLGVWGVGFLMAWVMAFVAAAVGAPADVRLGRHGLALGVVLVATLGWGVLRLDGTQARAVTVGAVTTQVGLTPEGLPSAEVLAQNTDALFARTAQAAERGARLVAWPEAATLVWPAGEQPLVERAQAFARARGVDLALAYAVVLKEAPLLLDNKVAFITSEGEVATSYRKHHPVPGEPSLKGTEPLQLVERPYGKVGLAICYDYDFPALAREHARLGAELVVVPASDWRGIDPVHTLMARVRAIEGGFSVLRAVRWSTSAGFDAYGRVRGWLPGQEAEQVLVTALPLERVGTGYARWGDWPALASLAYLAWAGVAARRRVAKA